jgi:hypothetical protein
MDKAEHRLLQLQARIVALEGLTASMIGAFAALAIDKSIVISKLRAYTASAETIPFPGLSPEEADLYAAELRDAIDSLVEFIVRHIERKKPAT